MKKWTIFAAFCIGGTLCWMLSAADITPGYTFTDGEKNVTAAKLNAATAGTVGTAFYTGKSAKLVPAGSDYMLIFDGASSSYKKLYIDSLLYTNVNRTLPVGASLTNANFWGGVSWFHNTDLISTNSDLNLRGQFEGGSVSLYGGQSLATDGVGGNINLSGGSATGGGSTQGGSINLAAGTGSQGGVVEIVGGSGTTTAGDVLISPGDATRFVMLNYYSAEGPFGKTAIHTNYAEHALDVDGAIRSHTTTASRYAYIGPDKTLTNVGPTFITVNHTNTVDELFLMVDCTAGNTTNSLANPTNNAGAIVHITRIDGSANNFVVNYPGGNKLMRVPNGTIFTNQLIMAGPLGAAPTNSIILMSSGTNWVTIGGGK